MRKGTKHSEKTLEKIRARRKLQVFSAETREKFAERQRKLVGHKHWNWKGGRKLIDGYVYVYQPNHPRRDKKGYVCEHRLVMEKKVGRYLDKTEVVHHIDGSRSNNKIENLVLCKSDSEHNAKQHAPYRKRNNGRFI